MNSEYNPRYKANFTIPLLHKLVEACDQMSQGHVYKAVFLLAYFCFLTLSNLAPSSSSTFDLTRHFLRGDVIFGPPGAHVIVKWAKAMQSSTKFQVVQVPLLSSFPLCPVSALKVLLASSTLSSSKPLFILSSPNSQIILTAPMISATLSSLLSNLGLNSSHYGFHAFRRHIRAGHHQQSIPISNTPPKHPPKKLTPFKNY